MLPFSFDLDVYDKHLLAALESRIGNLSGSFNFVAYKIVKLSGDLHAPRNATFATVGLGCLPLFDSDEGGWVARELLFTVCGNITDEDAVRFVNLVGEGLLDEQAAVPDGSIVEWPGLSDALRPYGNFEQLYFGRLLLPEGLRQIDVSASPRVTAIEIVPLTVNEYVDLEQNEESVVDYFRRIGSDPTDLLR